MTIAVAIDCDCDHFTMLLIVTVFNVQDSFTDEKTTNIMQTVQPSKKM